jgi:precorrin-2 dehydrogenase/sirohydrochlorin ferrochelatase
LTPAKKNAAPVEASPGLPMLRLAGRPALVVGGDEAAARAAETLVRCGALVKLLSPEPGGAAKALIKAGKAQHQAREFSPRDLGGMFFVVAADEPVINGGVLRAARAAGVLCASLEDPEAGDVRLLPTLACGPLLLAAHAPAEAVAAVWLEKLGAGLGPDAAELAELMARLAGSLLATSDGAYQARIMRALLDSDVAELLRRGEKAAAEAKALRIVGQTTRRLKS